MGFSRILSSLSVVSALVLSLPAASVARSLTQHVAARSSLDVCATIDESSFSYVDLYLPVLTIKAASIFACVSRRCRLLSRATVICGALPVNTVKVASRVISPYW